MDRRPSWHSEAMQSPCTGFNRGTEPGSENLGSLANIHSGSPGLYAVRGRDNRGQIVAMDLTAQSKVSVLLLMAEGREGTGDGEMTGESEHHSISQHHPAFGSKPHPESGNLKFLICSPFRGESTLL